MVKVPTCYCTVNKIIPQCNHVSSVELWLICPSVHLLAQESVTGDYQSAQFNILGDFLTEVHHTNNWFDGGGGEEVEAAISSWILTTFNRGKKSFKVTKIYPQITESFTFYLAFIVLWKSGVTSFIPVDASHCCSPLFPNTLRHPPFSHTN